MPRLSTMFRPAIRRAITTFLPVIALALVAGGADAQDVLPQGGAVTVRHGFLRDLDTVQTKILGLARAIPSEKYSWRPAEGVRSIGEAFMHIASEYYVFAPMAYGATPSQLIGPKQADFTKFEANSSKDSVLAHLDAGFAYMKKVLADLPPDRIAGRQKLFGSDRTIVETSMLMAGDLHEHLGQLIAYARMNGVVPPWSK